jgi:signal transduction histidine kinase
VLLGCVLLLQAEAAWPQSAMQRIAVRDFEVFAEHTGTNPPAGSASSPLHSDGHIVVPVPADGAYRWLRARVLLESVPGSAVALYVSSANRARVLVNGSQVGNTSVSDAESFGWNHPLFYSIPSALLRSGENIIDVRLSVNRFGKGEVNGMSLGPHTELQQVYDRVLFWRVTGPQITSLVTLLLGFPALLYWMRRRQDAAYGWFGLACVLASVRNGHLFIVAPALSGWYEAWASVPLHWMLVSLIFFSFRLCRQSFPRVERGLFIASVAWTLIVLVFPFQQVFGLGYVWLTALWIATIGFVAIQYRRTPRLELVLLLFALLVAQIFGGLDLLLQLGIRTSEARIYLMPYSMVVFSLVMGANLVDAFARARTQQERLNEELDARLAQREREIAIEHGRVLQLQHARVASEERERIVRNIHDGLGSQLISSILLVEAGTLTGPAVAGVLRECVDDLRLAIDSLKPAGNELLVVLGNFRYRMESRLLHAGVRLDWRIAADGTSPPLGSDQVLHTLRIVQEAFTNALKHALPRCVTVHFENRPGGGWALAVSDDGKGFDVTAHEGRGDGLRNMRTRAAQIPVRMEISSGERGTTVRMVSEPEPSKSPSGAITSPEM